MRENLRQTMNDILDKKIALILFNFGDFENMFHCVTFVKTKIVYLIIFKNTKLIFLFVKIYNLIMISDIINFMGKVLMIH